jgi:hypothetical protein
MPGFLAALSLHRESGTVVTCLTNVTRGISLPGLTADIMRCLLEEIPAPQPAVVRDVPCPDNVVSVLGEWWCEAEVTVFTWQDGHLNAHLAAAPGSSGTTFAPEAPDSYLATSGRLQGELLHVVRNAAGQVAELEWATYPYVRDPRQTVTST